MRGSGGAACGWANLPVHISWHSAHGVLLALEVLCNTFREVFLAIVAKRVFKLLLNNASDDRRDKPRFVDPLEFPGVA